MSDRNFVAILILIVVAIVGSIIFFGSNEGVAKWIGNPLEVATGVPSGEVDEDGNPVEVQPADQVTGGENAQVTIIEYADFECPACGLFWSELKQVEAAQGDNIKLIFRHNPLTSIHPNAFVAHRAAHAAAQQGKFWEMYDLLFERQNNWSRQGSGATTSDASTIFEGYAQELGLNLDQYRQDRDSEETLDYINSHLDSGRQLSVVGTPTLYINGELVESRSATEINALIENILNSDSNDTE